MHAAPCVLQATFQIADHFLGQLSQVDGCHAHLLSLLLAIPHAVLDNTYGKLGRFLDTWTGGAEGVHRVSTAEEALAWAEAAR